MRWLSCGTLPRAVRLWRALISHSTQPPTLSTIDAAGCPTVSPSAHPPFSYRTDGPPHPLHQRARLLSTSNSKKCTQMGNACIVRPPLHTAGGGGTGAGVVRGLFRPGKFRHPRKAPNCLTSTLTCSPMLRSEPTSERLLDVAKGYENLKNVVYLRSGLNQKQCKRCNI